MPTPVRAGKASIDLADTITLGDLLQLEQSHDEVISLLANVTKNLGVELDATSPEDRELVNDLFKLNGTIDNQLRCSAFRRVKNRRASHHLLRRDS